MEIEPQCGQWIKASKIKEYPQFHSTSMDSVRILLAVKGAKYPQFGRYIASLDEFMLDCSPSSWEITHWMPQPEMPNKIHSN